MNKAITLHEEVLSIFMQHANAENKPWMKAYMKNRFDFFGIKTEMRRQIIKPVIAASTKLKQQEVIQLAKKLYNEPWRECHYTALEILLKNLKQKSMVIEDIVLLEWFVRNNSWWDTVDVVAPKLMSRYFLQFPDEREPITDEWLKSGNIWLIRSAILFQLKYKEDTDISLLFSIILRSCHTREFFIDKAIGWILRENSKRIPDTIQDFVRDHKEQLAPLSVREGMRLIINN